jgi:hypothetical protein
MEHDGLILRERVLADVDPDQLLVALRSGRLRRVQRGIYVPRNIEYSPLTAARAAVLSSGIPDAVASHRTAGRLHELELPREKRCEDVTVARERRRKDRKDLCFHTRGLTVGDVQVHHGIPITVLSRTLADLACSLDRLPAVWMLDDAFRRGLSSGDAVARAVCRWRGGADCAAAVKRLTEADGVAESILETAGRLAILDAGLPLPVPQYKVYTPSGRLIARLDGGVSRAEARARVRRSGDARVGARSPARPGSPERAARARLDRAEVHVVGRHPRRRAVRVHGPRAIAGWMSVPVSGSAMRVGGCLR